MFFKKAIIALFSILILSSQANAQDMLVDTTIDDKNYDVYGEDHKFDVGDMSISWNPDGTISVEVLSTFIDRNKDNSYGNKRIMFGDLLIGTDGVDGTYDYAFKLTEMRGLRYRDTSGWQNFGPYQGDLYAISGTTTNINYHNLSGSSASNASSYNGGQVLGNKTGNSLSTGSWKTEDLTQGWERLTFTFDVSGIDDFKNASSLALSWAMTCANDVTHGVVEVARSVPEPATMIMLLSGLGFIAMRKKKLARNENSFSA